MELVALRLERLRPPSEVESVTVRAVLVGPVGNQQGDLFGPGQRSGRNEVSGLIERLTSRLGERGVLRPRAYPDAQPELAFVYDPWITAVNQRPVPRDAHEAVPLTRPIVLKNRPIPVEVLSVFAGGTPVRFHWEAASTWWTGTGGRSGSRPAGGAAPTCAATTTWWRQPRATVLAVPGPDGRWLVFARRVWVKLLCRVGGGFAQPTMPRLVGCAKPPPTLQDPSHRHPCPNSRSRNTSSIRKGITRSATPTVAYAELHCRTNFSFLEGASHPDELVERAAELGYAALAITDRDSLAGVVRAHVAAKDAGPEAAHRRRDHADRRRRRCSLWATDRAAYGRLARLLTLGRRSAPKGECRLTFDDVAEHADGSAGRRAVCRRRADAATQLARRYRDALRRPLLRRRRAAPRAATIGAGCEHRSHLARDGRRAARRRQRRALPRPAPPAAARRAHRHPPRLHRRRAGRPPLSQRRAAPEVAATRCATLFADCPGGRRPHASRSPTAARSRSTSCATSIPRNCARRA